MILLSCALLLGACQPKIQVPYAAGDPPNTPAGAPTAAAQPPQPAVSPSPTLSPTPLPSSTPAPSPTPLPSDTPEATRASITAAKPDPALAPPACREEQGKLETQTIDAGQQGQLTFTVYLPPCYQPHPARRYPVLYLLHGMNNDNQQWVRIGAPAAADELIESGQTPPFLIVMPKENDFNLAPEDSSFSGDLVNFLVPWIDQQYATCTERACRAIGGLSRGSAWAFRIGLDNWQMFGAIGAHSFSPFPNDLYLTPGWLAQISADQRPRIYIDIGTYDQAVPDAASIADKLSELRVPHEWHLLVGAHNEDYWKAHVSDYLRWYAGAWK